MASVTPRPRSVGYYSVGEQETLWHRLKFYLRHPVGPKPTVICPICQVDTLRIKGLDDGRIGGWDNAKVLPCGHMFGRRCLERSFETKPARCPLCDLELRYMSHVCPHQVEGILAPESEPESIDRVPPTIPEGGRIPLLCCLCRQSEVNSRTSDLAEALWNSPLTAIQNEYLEDLLGGLLSLLEHGTLGPSWAGYD